MSLLPICNGRITLPRWFVRSALAVTAIPTVTMAIWWWDTWPDRTEYKFITAFREGDLETIKGVMVFDDCNPLSIQNIEDLYAYREIFVSSQVSAVRPQLRNMKDHILCRKRFSIIGMSTDHSIRLVVEVRKGRVFVEPPGCTGFPPLIGD